MANRTSIEQLNSFLRGEIAAVETYQMALAKLDEISGVRDELLVCLKSHEDRVMVLQDAILECGGIPASSSGLWGAFAKAVEGGARVLGDKATIAALEQGEDHGLADYLSDLRKLDADARVLVATRVLPQQQQTHDRVAALRNRVE